MFRRLKQKLLMSVTIIALILTSVITYAESVTYTYDGLNRLIRAEYEDGTVIQYIYDQAGNRTIAYVNTTPPVTAADPPGGSITQRSLWNCLVPTSRAQGVIRPTTVLMAQHLLYNIHLLSIFQLQPRLSFSQQTWPATSNQSKLRSTLSIRSLQPIQPVVLRPMEHLTTRGRIL